MKQQEDTEVKIVACVCGGSPMKTIDNQFICSLCGIRTIKLATVCVWNSFQFELYRMHEKGWFDLSYL